MVTRSENETDRDFLPPLTRGDKGGPWLSSPTPPCPPFVRGGEGHPPLARGGERLRSARSFFCSARSFFCSARSFFCSARNPFRAASGGGILSAFGENEDSNPPRERPQKGFWGQQGFCSARNPFRAASGGGILSAFGENEDSNPPRERPQKGFWGQRATRLHCSQSSGTRGQSSGTRGTTGPILALLATLLVAPLVSAQTTQPANLTEGVGLTVYNQDFAIVRERRTMPLAAGRSEVKFKDVAATIVADTVHFLSLRPAGDAKVIEQNYEFDLVSANKLLDKYIDKDIGLITRDGSLIEGKLMSFDDGQVVLAVRDGIQMVPRGKNVRDIRFSALPGGLLTRPTLVWLVNAKQASDHLVEVSYRANAVNWRVDYRALADADGKMLDLSGWVTIDNRSGRTYEDARLKLMAGEVHVVKPQEERFRRRIAAGVEVAFARLDTPAFEEKAFAEYHLYELSRPATIKDQQVKQIELINIEQIPVKRKYQYRGEGDNVHVILEFKNAKETREGLGIPLPKGPIRVYQMDADKQNEFIGMDSIEHTPKNEDIKIRIGTAFDIKGERVQTNLRRPGEGVEDKDWRIRLRNHKDQPVKVEVLERLEVGGRNWEIREASHEWKKKDFQTITFDVNVPANGEVTITYSVEYTW